jgi:hypothetical protein
MEGPPGDLQDVVMEPEPVLLEKAVDWTQIQDSRSVKRAQAEAGPSRKKKKRTSSSESLSNLSSVVGAVQGNVMVDFAMANLSLGDIYPIREEEEEEEEEYRDDVKEVPIPIRGLVGLSKHYENYLA